MLDYSLEVTENLGIDEFNALSGFSFYPNPSSNVINLKSVQNIERVSIYNLLGQEVSNTLSPSTSINVSYLNAGAYMLKATINGQIGTYKILKK